MKGGSLSLTQRATHTPKRHACQCLIFWPSSYLETDKQDTHTHTTKPDYDFVRENSEGWRCESQGRRSSIYLSFTLVRIQVNFFTVSSSTLPGKAELGKSRTEVIPPASDEWRVSERSEECVPRWKRHPTHTQTVITGGLEW